MRDNSEARSVVFKLIKSVFFRVLIRKYPPQAMLRFFSLFGKKFFLLLTDTCYNRKGFNQSQISNKSSSGLLKNVNRLGIFQCTLKLKILTIQKRGTWKTCNRKSHYRKSNFCVVALEKVILLRYQHHVRQSRKQVLICTGLEFRAAEPCLERKV